MPTDPILLEDKPGRRGGQSYATEDRWRSEEGREKHVAL